VIYASVSRWTACNQQLSSDTAAGAWELLAEDQQVTVKGSNFSVVSLVVPLLCGGLDRQVLLRLVLLGVTLFTTPAA